MGLRIFVKIGAVNNLSDARYCAGMGVDVLGFNLDPNSKNHISLQEFKELTEWISGVAFVGEFETLEINIIQEAISAYKVDYIQISHPQILRNAGLLRMPIILKIELENYHELNTLRKELQIAKSQVNYFLLDGINPNISLEDILSLSHEFPLLMGTGISEDTVNDILDRYPLKGIALQGGDEIKPGYKDYDELAGILESLEVEDFD